MNATAAAAGGALDTFPKFLLLNADRFADRIAMRHKDYGIWQSWTWRRQFEEIRAFSLGLASIGVKRGDKVAVVGSNRPRLLLDIHGRSGARWYSRAGLRGLGGRGDVYVLDHAEIRFAVVQDQEQVDKLLSVADRIPTLEHIVYDEKRGLRDYDHTRLHGYDALREKGMALAADASAEARWREEIAKGAGPT